MIDTRKNFLYVIYNITNLITIFIHIKIELSNEKISKFFIVILQKKIE